MHMQVLAFKKIRFINKYVVYFVTSNFDAVAFRFIWVDPVMNYDYEVSLMDDC